ncbi:MAG: DUF4340 domain-containing protein [Candidatus Sericytochromatia bacterium]
MKPLYTLGMLAILLALGAYVFFFERQPVTPSGNEVAKPKIVQLQPAAVKTLTISRGEQKTSFAQDKPNHWRLLAPQQTEADSAAVNTLLDHLKDWQAIEVLEPAFKASEKPTFGLAPNPLKLEITTATGKSEVLIGNKTPINSGYYVLSGDGKQLYLSFINVPEELNQMLFQPPLPKVSPSPLAAKK